MATATYSHSSLLGGFNSTTGVFTNVYNTFPMNTTINDDYSPPADTNDTLSVSDGVIGLNNETYSGYTYNGYPVIINRGVNYKVYHKGEITDSGTGGTAIKVAEYPLCFLKGTHILTANGEVVVEDLQIGDLVVLDAITGRTEPVKFIFKDSFQFPFIKKLDTYPVCIKANALADNSPSRDLYVSPDHALLVDGVFAQAHTLINGISIYQVNSMPNYFEYYHIELANHQLILAENVLAETYIDNVARETFDNYAEYVALYPEEQEMEELDLPRAKSARQLPDDLKQNLLERAQQLYSMAQAA